MQKLIEQYINNPYNPEVTFALGCEYEQQGHTASALSYYLRTAEYCTDKNLVYEALIRAGKCLGKQGRRAKSEKGLYIHAVALIPERPEAHFTLSQFYEYHSDWYDSYTEACIGLRFVNNAKPTVTHLDYEGEYALIFQKAVAAWWIGRGKEARELLHYLADNYITVMNSKYKNLVQQNITSLGSGPDPFLRYTGNLYSKLRYKFPGAEDIQNNYAQTYQDMFILTMLKGKRNGKYLEIGAADPYRGSNTALLEKQFDWVGASLEILEDEVNKFRKERSNPVFLQDATKVDYDKFLQELNLGNEYDYLQVDCEPPSVTLEILKKIPLDRYKFAVITFEHDYYADITKSYRDLSRDYLKEKGYVLTASNIAPNSSSSYEDWWIHPELVDKDVLEIMKDDSEITKPADTYMLLQ
jgi:hypothetical protein